MKRIFLSVAIACATLSVSAQNTDALLKKANAAYQNKSWSESAALYKQAIDEGAVNASEYYNAACSYALAGDKESALRFLEGALKKGWSNSAHLQRDTDLQILHNTPEWPVLVEKAKQLEASAKRLWDSPDLKIPYKAELSAAEKTAGLSRLWSEVKYNFVNFDLVPDLKWDSIYMAGLKEVAETKTTADYYRVLMRTIAQLKDGHTNVYPADELSAEFYAQPALRTRLIENKVVVLQVYDEALKAKGIVPGTEVVSLNNIPVKEYAEKNIRPYQSASTPHDLDVRVYEYGLLRGPLRETLAIGLRDAKGKTFSVPVQRVSFENIRKMMPATPPFRLTWLKGNIAHVELNTFGNDEAAVQYLKHFPEISKADAIIFDVRNNGGGSGNVGFKVLSTLTDKPFLTSSWFTRDYRPAQRAWGNPEGRSGGNNNSFPADGKLLYTKPVVVLTSPRTYSAAEDFAIAFDVMKRGKLIGETTGGSTGQPLMFSLPGGGMARVCTKRDTYPDGKEFVGVGILPDVAVAPTVSDMRKGKDTVLEAAVKLVTSKS